jgi:primosomal protein N' (replication factor Y) (superfamily II helicase)
MRLVRVAVPVPALDALTYGVPDTFREPTVGTRVLVPLGKRIMTGLVIGSSLSETGVRHSGLGARGSTFESSETAVFESETTRATRTPTAKLGIPDSTSHRTTELPSHRFGSAESRTPNPESRQASEIKPIIDILDPDPFLPDDVVKLAAWVAEYYACGIGAAIAATMPPRAWIETERYARITERGHGAMLTERGHRRAILERLGAGKPVRIATLVAASRGGHTALMTLERDGLITITSPLKGTSDASRTVRLAMLTAQGQDIVDSVRKSTAIEAARRLGARQREALDLLQGAPDGIDSGILAQQGIGAATLARLKALGLVTFVRRRIERDPHDLESPLVATAQLTLTPQQAVALGRLSELAEARTFHTALLHGVTGSGKTEIYLRLAAKIRSQQRGVLILVPEIALTPAVAAIFRNAFGDAVAIQHSGLSDGERHDQWQRIRRGDVDVVVGTRSAVFAPVRALGLVIVDEEHDASYKQDETPRYNGRDVAVIRGRHADALVVLGSATPSLESYQNAQNARYALVTLDRRILDRPLADVRVVDMRQEYAAAGPDVILSSVLCDAITRRLEAREQVMVLLNRRGFATSVICRQCGATLDCPNCSLSLIVHRAARRARCHYCNFSLPIPSVCTTCGGSFLEQVGFGTERVEGEIVEKFPGARVARLDRDTIRRRGAISSLLARFAAGDLDVLVGTQMIAKGHDFARVTLVGVISADVGLGIADFRAAERTFQLLTQVAGRAGRGHVRGEAIVQTLFPNHYSIRHACRQDYGAFFSDEIAFRRAMRYPPAVALINAVVKARTFDTAMQDAADLIRRVRSPGAPYRVLGPAPAPLSRLKGEHRAQFFIKGTNRRGMREALRQALTSRPEVARRTIVDVDPLNVL